MTRDGPLLMLCLALALPGCLFAEPPQQTPRQTPVKFDLDGATPPTTMPVHFNLTDTSRIFRVEFVSEDAGEEVDWIVYENLNLEGEVAKINGDVDPSSLADETRAIRFPYLPLPGSRPCLQVTLMACHETNFDDGILQRCRSEARFDTAFATWWVIYGDLATIEASNFGDCPQVAQTP